MTQYDYAKYYTKTIAATGDPADIYYPVVRSTANPAKFRKTIIEVHISK